MKHRPWVAARHPLRQIDDDKTRNWNDNSNDAVLRELGSLAKPTDDHRKKNEYYYGFVFELQSFSSNLFLLDFIFSKKLLIKIGFVYKKPSFLKKHLLSAKRILFYFLVDFFEFFLFHIYVKSKNLFKHKKDYFLIFNRKIYL